MVGERGEIWWARLPEPFGPEPGFHRPVVIIQSDRLNRSRIGTVVAAQSLAASGCAMRQVISTYHGGPASLSHDSVVNVSQSVTLDRRRLNNLIGYIPPTKLRELDDGLRLVLAL